MNRAAHFLACFATLVSFALTERPALAQRQRSLATTTTKLSVSPASPAFASAVTLTATVTPGTPSGAVTFFDGVTVLGDAVIASNVATFTTLSLTPGAHSLKAYYVGDLSNKPSVSGKVSVTVASGADGGFNPAADLTAGTSPADIEYADLNKDGKNDVVVVNTGSNNVSVFLGNGDGSFQTAVPYAVGASPSSAVIADVNGDGILDIVAANEGTNTLSVLLGIGNGTFQTQQTIATILGPRTLGVADFNGDGRPDLVITSGNQGSVAIMLNTGTAALFDGPTTYTTPGTTKGLAIADFNGDGFADVAVANFSTSNNYVSIFLGKGDGTLLTPTNLAPGSQPVAVAAADFNGDGFADLAVANQADGTVSVFPGVGNGTFSTPLSYPAGNMPSSVLAIDVNGDSHPDLLLGDTGANGVCVLLNNGNGTFQSATFVVVGNGPRPLIGASFNGDEFVDLAVVNTLDNTVSVLLGIASTTTTLAVAPNPAAPGATVTLTASVNPAAASGNVNFYDGSTLLATVPLASGVASYSSTTFSLGPHTLTASYSGTDGPSTSAPVILNVQTPSSTTLVLSSPSSILGQPLTFTASVGPTTATGSVTFLDYGTNELGTSQLNPGSGTASLTTSLLAAGQHLITAHYNGDSVDQESSSAAASEVVTAASGGGYGTPAGSYATGTAPDAAIEGDFNHDGIADLAVANYTSGTVTIFLGLGNGAFNPGVSYAVGVNPEGIAIGDFNNDGKPDLAVSDNGSGGVTVLLGVGDGTFNPGAFIPTGTLPVGIAIADFNGDGNPDIVVVNSGANEVSVIPGNGNGTFLAAVNTVIPAGGLRAIVVGDFNADSKPDIAITGAGGAYVLFGTGAIATGTTFTSPVNYPAGGGPFGITSGVFTANNVVDLVVVNSQSNSVSVLLGNTGGSFLAAVNYPVGTFPQSAVVGDFNGDGFLDIAVANESSNNVSILYGNGTGAFQPAVNYAAGNAPVALVAGSFNSTGQTDLAVVNYQNNQVGIYLALLGSSVSLSVTPNPDPAGTPVTFTATVTPPAATGTVTFMDGADTVGTAPLVNNGTSDVATLVASLPAGTQTLTALYSGDSTYGQSTSTPVMDTVAQAVITVTLSAAPSPASLGQPVTLTAAISNSAATGLVTFYNGVTVLGASVLISGQAQLVTSALPAGVLSLYARYDGDVNDASAISAAFPFTITAGQGFGLGNLTSFGTGTAPVSVASADFNVDGRADLAVANSGSSNVSILLGNGDGTFSAGVTLAAGTTPTQVVTTDFNGDGKPDIAVSNSGTNNITVFTGNGNGTFSAGTSYPAGTAPSSLVIGDFNNDGKADVVVANGSGGNISFIYGNGDGTLGTTNTIPVGISNTFVAAGDFNRDGNADIAVADTATNVVWILLGQGNGQFNAPVSYGAGTTPESIAVGDFNGDGVPDLAVANSGSANVTVLLGNGDGTFQAAVPYASGVGTQYISLGDFNGDSIPDLAVAAQSGIVAVLIGNGNGTFQNAVNFPAGSTPVSLAVNNFNGDGKDQIAVANKGTNTVGILLDSAATLTAVLGSNQSTTVGSAFPSPLEVQANGFGVPVAGVTVSFSVPTSGPSAQFAGTGLTATAVTGSNGIATSPVLTANNVVGSYNVIATVGTASLSFALTNQSSSCSYSVTGGPLTYASTGGSGTLTVTASAPSCAWGASTDSGSWITLSQTSGTGNGSVLVTVAANTTGAGRSGNVFVAGQDFPVTEDQTAQIFADVPPTAYYFDAANLLYEKGITSGCGGVPLDYCPTQLTTRAEMAIFIVTSVYGGDNFTYGQTPYFADVPVGSFGFPWIQKMYELGITTGCGNGDYCPNDDVTRAEMAIFVIKARYGANLPFTYNQTPYFTDVPPTAFGFAWIQRMAQDMITSGCGPTTFCPDNPVDRGDMAIFIMRGLFNELLPAGTPVISSVSPTGLAPGQATTLIITGTNTSFQPGLSVINPIPGITFGTPTVSSATSLTVSVVVSTSAAAQPWPIEVVTGSQMAVLPNSFTVQ